MKPIYKSLVLEALTLSVALSLQAQVTNDDGVETGAVQANSLEGLKVLLVSPNVSGARDLLASGEATLNGDKIEVELTGFGPTTLATNVHRLIVSAVFGTQTVVLYALDIRIAYGATLADETQEFEDDVTVVSTFGGASLPEGVALEATSQQILNQIIPLTAIEPDLAAGKAAIAAAITEKGVTTASTDTMAQMAENISDIAQATYEIDGGEMYEKQLFGSLDTPNYWDLYKVMAALLSHGDLANYGGILLGEYYKGYDRITIGGDGAPSAGAGGGYVFSDEFTFNPDGSANLIVHTEDETHYWNDDNDGRGNRWVAWLFAGESHGYTITSVGTCPRSIHIGRHVGVIQNSVAGRVSEVVVTDGNLLDDFKGNYEQPWNKRISLHGLANHNGNLFYFPSFESAYVDIVGDCTNPLVYCPRNNAAFIANFHGHDTNHKIIVIDSGQSMSYINLFGINKVNTSSTDDYLISQGGSAVSSVAILSFQEKTGERLIGGFYVKNLYIQAEKIPNNGNLIQSSNVQHLHLLYHTNDHTKQICITKGSATISDVEIQQGWLKPLLLSIGDYSAEVIALQILDRLGTCTTETGQLTLQIGATNLSTITNDPDYSSYLTDAVDNKGWNVIA